MLIAKEEKAITSETDISKHPTIRPRRLRMNANIRRLVRETVLTPADFIYPLFVRHGRDLQQPIRSMPGQFQWTVDRLAQEIRQIVSLDIPAVVLFGIPETKDACGSDNYNPDGIIPRAIRMIKDTAPDLVVISDMCFCEYTDHGHCGVINQPGDDHYNPNLPEGYLLNDATLELLGRAAVVHAQAGAGIIAPSGMIDGMVGAIRTSLDTNGLQQVSVMSYAAKYASGFYGPFREAAESPPQFGDRSQYQMDPANAREALKEVALDVTEGADMLMVKPALPYLDVLSSVRKAYNLPLAAYQVSGEYAMLHAAADNGWIDLRRCALESLTSIKRAGADMILTYFAKDAVGWLDGEPFMQSHDQNMPQPPALPVTETSRLLRACRRENSDATPVWLMRQAGRYMDEYQQLRQKYSILEIIKTPELACEVTLQPIKAFDLDAAIIFADILPPLESMGLELDFLEGEGPIIYNPVRTEQDVARLRVTAPEESLSFTLDAIRLARAELDPRGLPLIGFSGAPFTLAVYAVEGSGSLNHRAVKGLMMSHPRVWHLLMEKLSEVVGRYLLAQAQAGAQVLQLFDSWVGQLAPEDYRQCVMPYTKHAIEIARQTGVPIIHFGTDTSGMLELLRDAGGDVIGVDWRINLDAAWERLGYQVAVQGNLDPIALLAPWDELQARAKIVLDQAGGRAGHIFNLGHGVLPGTPVDNVRRLVDFVHEYTAV